jgi:Polysaccharide lyase family 8, N terminal alpha-helical domain/Polysaccharide lyase family 8, super-sandwich domain
MPGWSIGPPVRRVGGEARERYCAAIDHFVPDPYWMFPPERGRVISTGANRVDLCQAVIVRALVTDDEQKLQHARDGLSDTWLYVTSGDGFYLDGSSRTAICMPTAPTSWWWTALTRRYLTLWIDQSVDPTSASYGYLVVPGASERRTAVLAFCAGVQVVRNTAAMQGIRWRDLAPTNFCRGNGRRHWRRRSDPPRHVVPLGTLWPAVGDLSA